MAQQIREYRYDFRGEIAVAAAGSGVGNAWVKADTSAAGSPTVQGLTGGGMRLLMDSTSEAQNLCLYHGDVLSFDVDELISFECICKTVATLDTTTQLAFGMTSARNDAIDSITEAVLFRCIADNNIVVESDDGTNNNDDVATGLTMGTSWQRFRIDFSERVQTQEPPSTSSGGLAHVGFYAGSTANNTLGSLRRVASGTRFDISNYSGSLQPFFQIQKTADTNVDNLDVLEVCITVKLPDYS